jgi:methyltransferase (TIGR00027 family)
MTALISAFARWYHSKHNSIKVFDDFLAGKIITEEEKQQVALNMSSSIGFFNPTFKGTKDEALRWIVDNHLSPTPLGRAAWAERALQTAVRAGTSQYLIVAAGYDSFAYRQPMWARKLQIFEIDNPFMIADKQYRVQKHLDGKPYAVTSIPVDLAAEALSKKLFACAAFSKSKLSFYSLLGISYYLLKSDFKTLLHEIALSASHGSTIVFDYPDKYTHTDQAAKRAQKQVTLAQGAGEAMLASYSYAEMEQVLSDCGFLIYEYITPDEITKQYFCEYNKANPQHVMTAFDNVNYCLAVKQ